MFVTRFQGEYKYRIFDGIDNSTVCESKWIPNLVLDAGLQHLSSRPIDTLAKVLTFGSSSQTPAVTDLSAVSATQDTARFANLSALSDSVTHLNDQYISQYEWFYRSWPANFPITIREFIVQPACDLPAWARNLLSIDLERQQGIEFTYRLNVYWPSTTFVKTITSTYITTDTTTGNQAVNTAEIGLSASPFFNPPANHKVVCDEFDLYTLSNDDTFPTKFNTVIWPLPKEFTSGSSTTSQGVRTSTVYTATSAVVTYNIATSAIGGAVKTFLLTADDLVSTPNSEFFAVKINVTTPLLSGNNNSWESTTTNLNLILTHAWRR